MVAACVSGHWYEAFRGENRETAPQPPHASPYFGIPELEGAGRPVQGLAGAPQTSRGSGSGERAIWGRGGFVLSSSPHHLREKAACQSFLLGALWRLPEWFETLRNLQQNTINTCSTTYFVSGQWHIYQLQPKKISRLFDVGRGTSPDGIERRRSRRRNTQVLACPDPVKHVGSHITKPHHLGASTAARKTTPTIPRRDPRTSSTLCCCITTFDMPLEVPTFCHSESPDFLRPSIRCDARSHLLTIF